MVLDRSGVKPVMQGSMGTRRGRVLHTAGAAGRAPADPRKETAGE
jgi:hypothetical protein